jgi:hypothetical protein
MLWNNKRQELTGFNLLGQAFAVDQAWFDKQKQQSTSPFFIFPPLRLPKAEGPPIFLVYAFSSFVPLNLCHCFYNSLTNQKYYGLLKPLFSRPTKIFMRSF